MNTGNEIKKMNVTIAAIVESILGVVSKLGFKILLVENNDNSTIESIKATQRVLSPPYARNLAKKLLLTVTFWPMNTLLR